jgi:hypothetical protein
MEEVAERANQALHGSGMGDTFRGAHAQTTAMQAALRCGELLVDSCDEVVDGQAESSPAQHPQADAQAEGEGLGFT